MTQAVDLSKLSGAEKDALILSLLPLVGQLETALARIAVLEAGNTELTARNAELQARLARLERPAKTPDNSALPPSKGQKSAGPAPGAKPPRKGRPGVARLLAPNPDRIIDARLAACPHGAAEWAAAAQSPQQVYDRIAMPPIRPDVTRVRLFGGRCVCCGARAVTVAPAGLEPGAPFGPSVEALVVYLHYAHAIGLERLRCLLGEIFGLSISEGALGNILARATAPLAAAAAAIAARVTAAAVVASDETSVRVMQKTQWEWVFVTAFAVLHIIRPSRGAAVVRALFGSIRPRVWVSDSLGSQRGHADLWQMGLAHLLRDAQYAVDGGDAGFALALKWLLLRAIAIGRRREALRDGTLAQYRADLDRRLDRVLALPRCGPGAEKLRRRIARDRAHLFIFVTDRAVPATNNGSERALRPSVIFRKVTNGFRSEWGAQTYAAFRSVVSTAKANRRSILDDLRSVLAAPPSSIGLEQPGVSNYILTVPRLQTYERIALTVPFSIKRPTEYSSMVDIETKDHIPLVIPYMVTYSYRINMFIACEGAEPVTGNHSIEVFDVNKKPFKEIINERSHMRRERYQTHLQRLRRWQWLAAKIKYARTLKTSLKAFWVFEFSDEDKVADADVPIDRFGVDHAVHYEGRIDTRDGTYFIPAIGTTLFGILPKQ